jgi:hypothetical protein
MPQSYDFIFISARDFWEKLQEKSLKTVNNFTQGFAQLCPRLWAFMLEIVG